MDTGGHENLVAGHCDDRRGRGGDTVNLDRDVALVIHQHIVDLGSGYAVTAGAVDPHGDVPGACQEFLLEQLGCDIIIKPTFLCDGAVEKQSPPRRSRCPSVPGSSASRTSSSVFSSFPLSLGSFCILQKAPASRIGSILPLIRYRSPPSSAGMRSRFSSSRCRLRTSTILATDGVAVHTALVITTEQTFQIELHKICSLFICCQKRPH